MLKLLTESIVLGQLNFYFLLIVHLMFNFEIDKILAQICIYFKVCTKLPKYNILLDKRI